MTNRLREFKNFGLISSIPQGLVDPYEMGKLASPSYEQYLNGVIQTLSATAEEVQLLPNRHGTDGFYIAGLRRG